MNKLMLALLFTPFLLHAQESKPFKGASRIVAQYAVSGDSLFTVISQLLISEGYTIEKRDKELMYIVTDDKLVKHLSYKMRAFIKGNQVEYTGKVKSGVSKETNPSYEQLKLATGIFSTKEVFYDIDKFVHATSALAITYSK